MSLRNSVWLALKRKDNSEKVAQTSGSNSKRPSPIAPSAMNSEKPVGKASLKLKDSSTNAHRGAVLCVEDSKFWRRHLKEILTEAGFKVANVSSLSEAFVEVGMFKYDIIVLDMELEDSGRDNTLKSLRKLSGNIPVVVCTSSGDEAFSKEAAAAGANNYVSKSAREFALEITAACNGALQATQFLSKLLTAA